MTDVCDKAGGKVTLALQEFMKASLFEKWLHHYDSNLPGKKMTFTKLNDCYRNHFNKEIVTIAINLNIILALFLSKINAML
jgi:hypothetical protein